MFTVTLRAILSTMLLCFLVIFSPKQLNAGTLKPLPSGAVTAEQQQLLDALVSRPDYFLSAMKLKDKANAGVVQKLEQLAQDKDTEIRTRAAYALVLIPCKESLAAAVEVALADDSSKIRAAIANGLLSANVVKLVGAASLLEKCKKGLADKKVEVQLAFAVILQRNGDSAGIDVLKKGLKNRDHHWRETSAEALAELGDDSGARILIKMLRYTDKNHPLLKANADMRSDKSGWANLLSIVNDERARVCGHLGQLKCKKALSVLRKLRKSPVKRVAAAAKAAIVKIEETGDGEGDTGASFP